MDLGFRMRLLGDRPRLAAVQNHFQMAKHSQTPSGKAHRKAFAEEDSPDGFEDLRRLGQELLEPFGCQ